MESRHKLPLQQLGITCLCSLFVLSPGAYAIDATDIADDVMPYPFVEPRQDIPSQTPQETSEEPPASPPYSPEPAMDEALDAMLADMVEDEPAPLVEQPVTDKTEADSEHETETTAATAMIEEEETDNHAEALTEPDTSEPTAIHPDVALPWLADANTVSDPAGPGQPIPEPQEKPETMATSTPDASAPVTPRETMEDIPPTTEIASEDTLELLQALPWQEDMPPEPEPVTTAMELPASLPEPIELVETKEETNAEPAPEGNPEPETIVDASPEADTLSDPTDPMAIEQSTVNAKQETLAIPVSSEVMIKPLLESTDDSPELAETPEEKAPETVTANTEKSWDPLPYTLHTDATLPWQETPAASNEPVRSEDDTQLATTPEPQVAPETIPAVPMEALPELAASNREPAPVTDKAEPSTTPEAPDSAPLTVERATAAALVDDMLDIDDITQQDEPLKPAEEPVPLKPENATVDIAQETVPVPEEKTVPESSVPARTPDAQPVKTASKPAIAPVVPPITNPKHLFPPVADNGIILRPRQTSQPDIPNKDKAETAIQVANMEKLSPPAKTEPATTDAVASATSAPSAKAGTKDDSQDPQNISQSAHAKTEENILVDPSEPISATREAAAPTEPVASTPLPKLTKAMRKTLETLPDIYKREAPPVTPPRNIAINRADPNAGLFITPLPGEELGVNLSVSRPKLSLQQQLEKGYHALVKGHIEAAIATYKAILKDEPLQPDALFGLATSYHRDKQIDVAHDYYSKLLEIDPHYPNALGNYLILISNKSPHETLEALQTLAENNTDSSPILAQLAFLQQKLGKPHLAIRTMVRAVKLSPESLVYRYNLAVMLDQIGEYEKAGKLYQYIVDAYYEGMTIPGDFDDLRKRLHFIRSNNAS